MSHVRQDPVFVVGAARSGTSLLQAMLAAQEGFASFPETHFVSRIAPRLRENDEGRISGSDLGAALAEQSSLLGIELADIAADPPGTLKEVFEEIVQRCLAAQGVDAAAVRWVEKTPDHIHHLRRLAAWYPAARIVAVVRHPVDVILSQRRNLTHQRGKPVRVTAQHWAEAVNAADVFAHDHPDRLLSVRYEDLLGDLQTSLRRIGSFLGTTLSAERATSFAGQADRIARPEEVWKAGLQSGLQRGRAAPRLGMPGRGLLRMQCVTRDEMLRHGYRPRWAPLQRLYDRLVAFRSRPRGSRP